MEDYPVALLATIECANQEDAKRISEMLKSNLNAEVWILDFRKDTKEKI